MNTDNMTPQELRDLADRKERSNVKNSIVLLETPDVKAIQDFAESYIKFLKSPNFNEDNAYDNYAFETIMEACYGEDIFDKINAVIGDDVWD